MIKKNLLIALALLVSASVQPFAGVSAQGEHEPQIRITQVDNSQFPNVTVYVSVTNAAGEPVGIDPATILLQENGQTMQPVEIKGGGDVVSSASIPITTMLVIDISGSMEKNGKLAAAKEAAKSYVNQMRTGDQAGLITYDTGVYTVQPITTDTSALINAIDSLKSGSDTAMYNALMEAERALANGTGRKAIIVLTDGMDNRSQSTQDDVIAAIGQSGLTISAIGFGDASSSGQSGLNEGGLRSLADLSGGVYGYATNADALKSLYQQQSRVLQSEYQITFVSPAALRDGINRNISVSLTTNSVVSEGQYNPGGVLPEVSSRSWSTFGYILAGLLILLVLPMVFNGVLSLFRRSKGSYATNRSLGRTPPSMAKGRIKLK